MKGLFRGDFKKGGSSKLECGTCCVSVRSGTVFRSVAFESNLRGKAIFTIYSENQVTLDDFTSERSI